MASRRRMHIEGFFDPPSRAVSYLLLDTVSRKCAVIDSVLDYDHKSGRIDTFSADRVVERVQSLGAELQWILETHVHVDHMTAAYYLKQRLGGTIGIGQEIRAVQETLGRMFNACPDFARDGSQFDHLFVDEERFEVGTLECRALHTPGHTPACMTYVASDGSELAAFVGDTLLMPDAGTARCDFPGGNPRALFRSINRVLSLPAHARLYMGHDLQADGQDAHFISTVADEREANIHVRDGISEEEFVTLRSRHDARLGSPDLFLPSVQVNMRAGRFPTWKANTFHAGRHG